MNWPVRSNGSRLASIGDAGAPQWTNWRENYELFGNDPGFEPSWSADRQLQQRDDLPPVDQIPPEAMKDRRVRLLYESKQAQTDEVLWDQNGNQVYYEVLVNDSYFSFVVDNKLYTIDGQIAYTKQGPGAFVSFKYGSCTESPTVGTMTLKFAWKVLGDNDDPGRYLAMDAYVATADQQWVRRRVGLVGMNISQKTLSSSNRWIWSTFEQVDNVTVDDADVVAYASKGKSLQPSFTSIDCPDCPVNVAPTPDTDGVRRTQVRRLIEIPDAVRQVNEQVRRTLHDAAPDAPWRYYQLIGTQFSTVPPVNPTAADAGLPSSVTNRGGGQPDPTYLTNTTLETYTQAGNQKLKDLVPGTSPANEDTLVFGTQSCMGCHVAAGLAVARGADGKVVRQHSPGRISTLPSLYSLGDYNYQFQEAR